MVSTFPPLKLSAVPSSTFVQQEVYVPLRTHSTLFGLIWTFCVSKWGTSRVPDTFFDQDSFPVQSGLSSEVQNTYMTQTLCRDISVVTEFTERRTVCLWPSMSIFDSFIFRNNCLSLSWVEGTNTEDRVMKANHKISLFGVRVHESIHQMITCPSEAFGCRCRNVRLFELRQDLVRSHTGFIVSSTQSDWEQREWKKNEREAGWKILGTTYEVTQVYFWVFTADWGPEHQNKRSLETKPEERFGSSGRHCSFPGIRKGD